MHVPVACLSMTEGPLPMGRPDSFRITFCPSCDRLMERDGGSYAPEENADYRVYAGNIPGKSKWHEQEWHLDSGQITMLDILTTNATVA
ncbi:MAG: hypothetical protein LBF19_04065 [Prevotellaceae bacterium]|nr:hypothetical protein [Prevotellaceae bacterium]